MKLLVSVAFLVGVGLSVLGSSADSRELDEFNSGASGSGTFFSSGSMIGGERDHRLATAGTTVQYSALGSSGVVLNFGPADNVLYQMVYDGDDGDPTGAVAGLGGSDLTDGGTADRFVVEVVDVVGSVNVVVAAGEQTNPVASGLITVSAPGRYEFLFDDVVGGTGVDLTNVGVVLLVLSGLDALETITIDRFATEGAPPIDSFLEEFPLVMGGSTIQDTADAVGGQRDICDFGGAPNAQYLVERGGFEVLPPPNSVTLDLQYDRDDDVCALTPQLQIDPTGGGVRDQVVFEVGAASLGVLSARFRLGPASDEWVDTPSLVITGPGKYRVPFADLTRGAGIPSGNLDFSDLRWVRGRVTVAASGFIDLDAIKIEPAPPLDDFTVSAVVSDFSILDDPFVEGGERDFSSLPVGWDVEIAEGMLQLANNAGATGGVTVTYDGDDGTTSTSFGLDVDVTRNGAHDRFGVTVQSVVGNPTVNVLLWDDQLVSGSAGAPCPNPGVCEIAFSGYPSALDLETVAQMSLNVVLPPGASISLGELGTVLPEPTGALPLSSGLAALWASPRRRGGRKA
ncbi:MAG: hypothetical protein AAF430_25170 [Myxococcota bacterium]